MELNTSEEITCKYQNHSFVTNNCVSQALCLNSQITKINLKNCQAEQFSKTSIAMRVIVLQFDPSVSCLVFALLFKPFVIVLSGYFNVSLYLMASPNG